MFLSVVSPIYFAENTLDSLAEQIIKECDSLAVDYEVILVDDGSTDQSWKKIEALSSKHKQVRGVKLSRNFGQHYAISCGIEQANGTWIVVMDGDLQDHPREIKRFLEKTREGYKIVTAKRIARKDTALKRWTSILFWKTLGYLIGKPLDHTVANFGIYHLEVIRAVTSMRDNIRFFPTMVNWVGFRQTSIAVEHNARISGKSTYSLSKMLRLALDVILANSEKPLRMVTKTGIVISLISFVIGIIYAYRLLTHQILVPGYASIILSIWFLGGLIIFILGILGLYLSKTFDAVKHRPYYIIEKITS